MENHSHGRSDAAQIYGIHLMLRLGSVEGVQELDSPVAIEEFLRRLVRGIGMRILDGPYMKTEAADSESYGHSGIVLLYESHAAVHTYPTRRALFLDVFSCKAFEVAEVLATARFAFGDFEVVETSLLDRGHHWGSDAPAELNSWTGTR